MGEVGCVHQLLFSQPVSYSELRLKTSSWPGCSPQVWKDLALAGWTVDGRTPSCPALHAGGCALVLSDLMGILLSRA